MALWVQILGFVNGEPLDDYTMNRPVRQLRERTDFLYSQLQAVMGAGAFESVRLPNAPLTVGSAQEPAVGDVVFLNPASRTYEKAVASVNPDATVFQTASDSAYAVGILVEKTGTVGTVVVSGRLELDIGGVPWDLSDVLEQGETFRAGPYYLSSFEPGKLTAVPSGPAIYLGVFADSAATPGRGGWAVLNPCCKDVGEAHMHRAFALTSQPAGSQLAVSDPATDTHRLYGFNPKSTEYSEHGSHTGAAGNVLEDGLSDWTIDNLVGLTVTNTTTGLSSVITANNTTQAWTADNIAWSAADGYAIAPRCRLLVLGTYLGDAPVSYTLTLTDATGVVAIGAGAPYNGALGFEEAYLKWESDDPTEGSGLVRVTGYETPVPFGTKGLQAVLENALEGDDAGWGWLEAANGDLSRRQWTVAVPAATKGWLQRRFRQLFVNRQGTDGGFTLRLFGEFDNAEGDTETQIKVMAGRIYALTYSANPADGDTVEIGAQVFEFDEDDSVAEGNTRVPIVYGDPAATYANLLEAALAYETEATTAALSAETGRFFICVPPGGHVDAAVTAATLSLVASGGATDLAGANKPSLLVFDGSNRALVPSTGYWSAAEFYAPVRLTNGLQLMFVPYSASGVPVVSSAVASGDYWTAAVIDEAPGAKFVYAIGMDAALRMFYPPMPFSAAALTVNGLEQLHYALHPDSAVFRVAYGGLYWLTDAYSLVPWPYDWVSSGVPGDSDVRATLYLVHMRMSDTSVVTSLQPAPNSPLRFYRCGTRDAASTGDLAADVDLALNQQDANAAGYKVFKGVRGSTLISGPVVSKLIPGPGISLNSPPGVPEGCGDVMVGLSNSQEVSGEIEDIALDNAKQELIGPFPYIRLLGWTTGGSGNIPSGLSAKFQIPHTLTGGFQILLYITLFGEEDIAAGTGQRTAGLVFNYSMLRDFDPSDDTYGTLLDNLITQEADSTVEVPIGDGAGITYSDGTVRVYKAFDPMVIHNNPNDVFNAPARIVRALGDVFPQPPALKGATVVTTLDPLLARPGSLVAIELRRGPVSNPATEYTGPLGIMHIRWRLVRVSA